MKEYKDQQERDEKMQEQMECPGCGMLQDQWRAYRGEGYLAPDDGEIYCCQGCAEDMGCVCLESERESA